MTNSNQELASQPSQPLSVKAAKEQIKKGKKNFQRSVKMIKIFGFLVILVLIGLFLFFLCNNFLISELRGKKNVWQAVFLTNNQVYFGKIIKETKKVLLLREVYYLQVTQGEEKETSLPKLSVVKLGQEPHGPEDEMRINKEHILFVEDLKPDSEVVKTIEEYKKTR